MELLGQGQRHTEGYVKHAEGLSVLNMAYHVNEIRTTTTVVNA